MPLLIQPFDARKWSSSINTSIIEQIELDTVQLEALCALDHTATHRMESDGKNRPRLSFDAESPVNVGCKSGESRGILH